MTRILILGGGGREHALAWKLAGEGCAVTAAPGNPGIAELAECRAVDPADPAAVVALAAEIGAELVVVGPEAPLAAGVADALAAAGIPCFGPSAAAARLETSKTFAKEVADAVGAPTAGWARFDDADAALAHLARLDGPCVVKADGLAAGKGVVVADDRATAEDAVREMFGGAFGAAGASVLIEERMQGPEASLFALCDGTRAVAFGAAQDHKRLLEGDRGPNTGGMGAFCPAPVLTPALEADAMARIVEPVVAEMARRGTPFRGVLYAGLMLTAEGPKLVEFNVRFGDPECQALMLRLESPLAPLLAAAATGDLGAAPAPRWRPGAAAAVVMAARGYPGPVTRGERIDLSAVGPDAVAFHAGTARAADGSLVSAGGRVLALAAAGATLAEALARAHAGVAAVDWPGAVWRRDIGAAAAGDR